MKSSVMKRLLRWDWLAFLLVLVSLYQTVRVIDDYALLWAKRTWRNRSLSSMERSALFLLGGAGADFMNFITSVTPPNGTIIVPERSENFSQQSILQWFLFPRAIVACDCNNLGGKCNPCLNSGDVYVPAMTSFPPPGSMDGSKKLIPFQGSTGYYLGVYAPAGAPPTPPTPTDAPSPNLPLAFLIDLLVLGGLGLIGAYLARLAVPWLSWLETASLAVPLGAGALTWVIFVASWAGIPVTLWSVGIAALLTLAVLVFIRARLPRKAKAPVETRGKRMNAGQVVVWAGILGVFVLATVIAVGRTYSIYDDIANWALKGYAMASKGTIWAGADWGGHALAYPMGLPLSISFFKLASGDVLPGSKLLFPISLAALLAGCYAFWRRLGVRNWLAQAGVFFLLTAPAIFLHATLGYANMPFAAYLVLGVLWAIEGLWSGRKGDLLLSGMLFAFSAWTRPEGIGFAAILVILLILAKMIASRSKKVPLAWLLPLIILPGFWLVFSSGVISGDQIGGAVRAYTQQILDGKADFTPLRMAIEFALSQGMSPGVWGVILPGSLVLLILSIFRLKESPRGQLSALAVAALGAAAIPIGLFIVESSTDSDFSLFLQVSFDRAYLPAAFLLVLLAVAAIGAKMRIAPGPQSQETPYDKIELTA